MQSTKFIPVTGQNRESETFAGHSVAQEDQLRAAIDDLFTDIQLTPMCYGDPDYSTYPEFALGK
ncbi:MAG: hypothetical protein KDK27_07465 [Leptospiraceae bacterium]|nr:hypothetical protein [Leptospiraceae bacterium]